MCRKEEDGEEEYVSDRQGGEGHSESGVLAQPLEGRSSYRYAFSRSHSGQTTKSLRRRRRRIASNHQGSESGQAHTSSGIYESGSPLLEGEPLLETNYMERAVTDAETATTAKAIGQEIRRRPSARRTNQRRSVGTGRIFVYRWSPIPRCGRRVLRLELLLTSNDAHRYL